MAHKFKVGDTVHWSAEGNSAKGKVTKVHTKDVEFMGRMRRCSADEPQYEVESDQSGKKAMHKEDALRKH